MKEEESIRKAAAALHKAIDAGREAGLVVAWPPSAAGLDAIAISETGRAAPPADTNGTDKADK